MRPEEIRAPIEQLRKKLSKGKREYRDAFFEKKCRNMEVQTDVMFNSFCRLNQILDDCVDYKGTVNQMKNAVNEAIITVVNVGKTNPNADKKEV